MIKRMPAKFGSCAFCHVQFDIEHQEEIIYDSSLRRAFHLGCPNEVIEREKIAIQTNIQPDEMLAQKQVAFRQSLQHVKTKTNTAEAHIVPELAKLYDGKFSIPLGDSNQHVTVQIRTQNASNSRFPGSRTVKIHYGRHDSKEFILCGFITTEGQFRFYKSWQNSELGQQQRKVVLAAVKLVLTGESNSEFALNFAKISKCCWHCGKDLTDPYTIDHLDERGGLGPICYQKIGKEHPEILKQFEVSIHDIRPKIVL